MADRPPDPWYPWDAEPPDEAEEEATMDPKIVTIDERQCAGQRITFCDGQIYFDDKLQVSLNPDHAHDVVIQWRPSSPPLAVVPPSDEFK